MTEPAKHHDLDQERAVLASILLDNGALDEAQTVLCAEDFFSGRHKAVFQAMQALAKQGRAIDALTLRGALMDRRTFDKAGGEGGVLELTELVPEHGIEHYARRVAELSTVREMVRAARRILASAERLDDVQAFLEETEARVLAVAHGRRSDQRAALLRHVLEDTVTRVVDRCEAGGTVGLSTGLPGLDRLLGGFRAGQLIIVAGRPGMGKSAFAGQVAVAAAQHAPVAMFSLEMSSAGWAERLIAAKGQIASDRLRTGALSQSDWAQITTAIDGLASLPIQIDDTPAVSLPRLRSACRRFRARGGLGLVIVDYLQLMRSGERHANREAEVAAISRGLKALAKELGVPVLALSQLNRALESRNAKRPMLSDLRESGQLEQDADVVLFVHRPGLLDPDLAPPTRADLILAKQRSGPVGIVPAVFQPSTCQFFPQASGDFEP